MTPIRQLIAFFLLCIAPSAVAQEFRFDEVTYTPQATTFKLFAPKKAKKVMVNIENPDGKDTKSYPMKYVAGGYWTATVKKNLKNHLYTFNAGWGETPGVFAKAVTVNGQKGAVVDLRETDPEGWEHDRRPPLNSPADLVIYEMHHRDYSVDSSSGMLHKGKFLALTEEKAIAHLQELGINAVHILPSFDYASVDETRLDTPQYNWGYDPLNYNVPEGSYSTNPYDPKVRIREFKQMVQALHKAGIRVILDVVYNHTYSLDGSNFQKTYPDYYYRKRADGSYSDGSACGNETASEQPLMRRFMIESMKYWVNEYHIDGFRVDLMGMHDIETMNQIREELQRIDPSIFIYGEGWSASACAYPAEKLAMKANTARLNGIAAFSDELRDALRGPFNDNHKGAFLAGIAGEEESIKAGIAGMTDHPQVDYSRVNYTKKAWAGEPTQMISYVSCHDDMCLVDRIRTTIPDISDDELIRLSLLAQTAVFTSQGIPFMLSGEEMLRNKKFVHNSFKSPDSINALDWTHLQRYPQVFDYYKGLIALRKSQPAFRLRTAEAVRRNLTFLPTQPCVVGYRLKNSADLTDEKELRWDEFIVILNANKKSITVSIPKGSYTVIGRNGRISCENTEQTEGGDITVDRQSALILGRISTQPHANGTQTKFIGGCTTM